MEIAKLMHSLRSRLSEYRYARKNVIVSKHINAIDIAISLVEYAIEDKRPIDINEQNWFDASYYIGYVLDGSEWEDLGEMYSQLAAEVKNLNYFR
jgi:hypothetical protein